MTIKITYVNIILGDCESNIGGNAAVAQSVERRIGSAEVTGPIPVSSFHMKSVKSVDAEFTGFFVLIFFPFGRDI